MAQCSQCGAPFNGNGLKCGYCGATQEVDLKGIHWNTTHAPTQPRNCPKCKGPMPSLDIGVAKAPFLIERCATCHGIFFDRGELEALLEREVQNVPSIDHPRLNELIEGNPSPIDAKVQYWKCPVCQVLMNRASYGQRSGVVAHSCRNHGVWLEAGSLQRLLQWRKAGGELLNAQVKREEREFQAKNDARKAEYRREMDEQLSAASMMGGSSGTGGRYRRNQQGLVLDSLVESIVRLFVK